MLIYILPMDSYRQHPIKTNLTGLLGADWCANRRLVNGASAHVGFRHLKLSNPIRGRNGKWNHRTQQKRFGDKIHKETHACICTQSLQIHTTASSANVGWTADRYWMQWLSKWKFCVAPWQHKLDFLAALPESIWRTRGKCNGPWNKNEQPNEFKLLLQHY